jgi:hypothetical protein
MASDGGAKARGLARRFADEEREVGILFSEDDGSYMHKIRGAGMAGGRKKAQLKSLREEEKTLGGSTQARR